MIRDTAKMLCAMFLVGCAYEFGKDVTVRCRSAYRRHNRNRS